MKMIKRGFGILLVAVLLLNLFGATVSAAVMPDRVMSIRLRAIESNVQAGDTVTLIVNFESKKEFPMWNTGTFEFGFNANYFSIGTFEESIVYAGYAYEGTLNLEYCTLQDYGTILPEWEKTAFGWDTYRQIGCCERKAGEDWVDMSPDGGTDAFAVKIQVKSDTPDGVYYLGFGTQGFQDMTSYMNEQILDGGYEGFGMGLEYGLSDPDTPIFDLSEAVVAITVGDAAAEPVVTNNDVKVQWDNDDAHIKLGYRATISDLELTTTYNAEADAYEVNELSEVGVIFSTTITDPTLADVDGGTALKAICNTLYDNKDGTYSFRAVVKGAPIDNTTTINSVMYITLADGTTSYYSLSGAKSPKEAYDAGRLNGMPDFGV